MYTYDKIVNAAARVLEDGELSEDDLMAMLSG